MSDQSGKVVRVADHGLAFVSTAVGGRRRDLPFTFDKIRSYRGETARDLGLKKGTEVQFSESDGRIESIEITARK